MSKGLKHGILRRLGKRFPGSFKGSNWVWHLQDHPNLRIGFKKCSEAIEKAKGICKGTRLGKGKEVKV